MFGLKLLYQTFQNLCFFFVVVIFNICFYLFIYLAVPGRHVGPWIFIATCDMSNLDSILESRNITLPMKVHLVKAMVFPVVM